MQIKCKSLISIFKKQHTSNESKTVKNLRHWFSDNYFNFRQISFGTKVSFYSRPQLFLVEIHLGFIWCLDKSNGQRKYQNYVISRTTFLQCLRCSKSYNDTLENCFQVKFKVTALNFIEFV